MKHIRAAVIGGSQSGKTYRVAGYVRGYWLQRRLRSLVFDPWRGETDWGPGAWVTRDFEAWKRVVLGTSGCAVVWDEASGNGGRDRDNVALFSEIRHRHPALFCIGHAYSVILPIMRVNLTDLFIASADPRDAEEWCRVMRDPDVMRAVRLGRYEFLHKRNFEPVRILKDSKEAIQAGILP